MRGFPFLRFPSREFGPFGRVRLHRTETKGLSRRRGTRQDLQLCLWTALPAGPTGSSGAAVDRVLDHVRQEEPTGPVLLILTHPTSVP